MTPLSPHHPEYTVFSRRVPNHLFDNVDNAASTTSSSSGSGYTSGTRSYTRSNDSSHSTQTVLPRQPQLPYATQTRIDAMLQHHTPFASGAFGSLYMVTWSPVISRQIQELWNLSHDRVRIKWPQQGQRVALKIQVPGYDDEFEEFKTLWKKELDIHKTLQHLDFIPTLYMGMLAGRNHITIMEYIQGRPAAEIRMTPEIYNRIEHAIYTMWKMGLAHTDFHDENVLVTPDGEIYIIDFGLAVHHGVNTSRLPKNPIKAWYTILQPEVNKRVAKSGYIAYNPNGRALKVYKQRLKEEVRQRLRNRVRY